MLRVVYFPVKVWVCYDYTVWLRIFLRLFCSTSVGSSKEADQWQLRPRLMLCQCSLMEWKES